MNLPQVCGVISSVKGRYGDRGIRTSVDTNGLVKCLYKEPAKMLEDAGLDDIWISVNAVNGEDYLRLCRPMFCTEAVFDKLVEFVRDCVSSSIHTKASFVVDFECRAPKSSGGGKIATSTRQEYEDFAGSLGIPPEDVVWRDYVPPNDS
jgi:hypothetical protein